MHTPECSVVLGLPPTFPKNTYSDDVDEEGNVKEQSNNHIITSKDDHHLQENVSNR